MSTYRINFVKTVYDPLGHAHDCLQGAVLIRKARSSARAISAAQRRFERLHRIARWNLHADAIELRSSVSESAAPDSFPGDRDEARNA